MTEPQLQIFEREVHLRNPTEPGPHIRCVIGRFGVEVYTAPYQKLTCTPEQIEAWSAALRALAAKARAIGQRATTTENATADERG